MVVRATSPKVPMCGSPEGRQPVSNTTSSLGCFFSRATILRASWNGQAFEFSAISRRAGTWASTVDINGSPAADSKNHTRWRQSKRPRCSRSPPKFRCGFGAELSFRKEQSPTKPRALLSSLEGSPHRREGHIQLRSEPRKGGDDGDRHAGCDQRILDGRGTAFLACETRQKHFHDPELHRPFGMVASQSSARFDIVAQFAKIERNSLFSSSMSGRHDRSNSIHRAIAQTTRASRLRNSQALRHPLVRTSEWKATLIN